MYVHELKDVPKGVHYVIMKQTSHQEYTPPYDHRDKDGSYSTVKSWDYMVFEKMDEWKKELIDLETRSAVYVAFKVDGLAKVEKTVTFDIKPTTR